jgi:type I restriction-modification system DNA methylase subunit
MTSSSTLVKKLWNYCNILRDDGLSYGDYVEQLTFLLFLKMANDQAKPPFNKLSPIPKGFGWDALPKQETVVSANLRRATRLRQSILQKAFTGELLRAG